MHRLSLRGVAPSLAFVPRALCLTAAVSLLATGCMRPVDENVDPLPNGVHTELPKTAAPTLGDLRRPLHFDTIANEPHARPAKHNGTWKPWTSGHPIVALKGSIWVIDQDNRRIVRIDRASGTVRADIATDEYTDALALDDQGRLFVTLRDSGRLLRIEDGLGNGLKREHFHVGPEARGVAVSPDMTYVASISAGHRRLVIFDAHSGQPVAEARTADRPRAVAINDAGRVFVVHQQDGVRSWDLAELLVAGVGYLAPVTEDGRIVDDASKATVYKHVALGGTRLMPRATINSNKSKLGVQAQLGKDFPIPHAKTELATRAVSIDVDPATGTVRSPHVYANSGTPTQALLATLASGQPNANKKQGGGYGGQAFSGGHRQRPVEPSVMQVSSSGKRISGDGPYPRARTLQATSNGNKFVGEGAPNNNFQNPQNAQIPKQVGDTAKKPLGAKITEIFAVHTHQPMDARHHPTHNLLFVVAQGSDMVQVFNTAPYKTSTKFQDGDLPTVGMVNTGRGPRGIAFSEDGTEAYILDEHDFRISIAQLDGLLKADKKLTAITVTNRIVFGASPLSEAAQVGRSTFHFARNLAISSNSDFACADCHVDGDEDKHTWLVVGGSRQTPALAGRLAGTAPFNWVGSEDELKDNMTQTISRMGGHGLNKIELTALETFLLTGMEAMPTSPFKRKEGLTDAQERGQKIFMDPKTACASCHTPGKWTDGKRHEVGTSNNIDKFIEAGVAHMAKAGQFPKVDLRLNTPSLSGLWHSAPYLHDGSAKSLMDVLNKTAKTMGRTDHLTEAQKRDLVAYLLTL